MVTTSSPIDELTELKAFIARMKIQASRSQSKIATSEHRDTRTVTEKEAPPTSNEVGDAIFDYLKGMEGKPLTESMWAPKSATQRRLLIRGPRKENHSSNLAKNVTTTWESLVPTKVGEPKSDITESKPRMPHLEALPKVDASTQTEDAHPKLEAMDTTTEDGKGQPEMPPPDTPAAGDIKPKQPDLPPEFLKKWAHKQKALLAEVGQSNNDNNRKPGQSAPAGGSSSAVAKPAEEDEDRRFKQYFSTWGTQEKRDRPRKLPPPLPFSIQLQAIQQTDPIQAAEVRTAIIKPLPPNATLAFITNLVYGGPLERIRIHVGGKGASVTFLNPADCKRFFDSTANGLAYNTSPPTGPVRRFRHLDVELSDTVEPVVGKLYEYKQKGLTRCVKAVPVDDEITMPFLQKMAADKNRSVVKVQEGRGIANVCYLTVPTILTFFTIQFAEQNGTGPLYHLPLWQHRARSPVPSDFGKG